MAKKKPIPTKQREKQKQIASDRTKRVKKIRDKNRKR